MGLLLAAALAAHIQTGQDLLAVCHSDIPTCNAFIRAAAYPYQGGCVDFGATNSVRRLIVSILANDAELRALPAEATIYRIHLCD